MDHSARSEPAAAPLTARAAVLGRLRRHAPRTAVFMAVLCVSIALVLTAFERGGLGTKLVYSFAIGLSCWAITEGTRLVTAGIGDALRSARRRPPSVAGFSSGWRGIAPGLVLCMLAGPPLGTEIADRLTGNHSPSLLRLESTNTRITVTLTVVASLASVFALSMMERLASARALAEGAQRQAAENQLRLLQSQLEPHMLFNTLANLRVLIAIDPPRAQAMLDRIIAFLRATLNASQSGAHPLAAEFAHLSDYLALMGVRMGQRLQVRLDLPEGLAEAPVPPLLLQPLVENAIKHGLEPKVEGGRIDVLARQDGQQLVLEVRDTGVGLQAAGAAAGGGFGLTQVRERLATLYGARAGVRLQEAPGGGTLATLRLPLA